MAEFEIDESLEGIEVYREYHFGGPQHRTIHRIEYPLRLQARRDGTTHRVLDSRDRLHIVPAPGHFGCALVVGKSDGAEGADF